METVLPGGFGKPPSLASLALTKIHHPGWIHHVIKLTVFGDIRLTMGLFGLEITTIVLMWAQNKRDDITPDQLNKLKQLLHCP